MVRNFATTLEDLNKTKEILKIMRKELADFILPMSSTHFPSIASIHKDLEKKKSRSSLPSQHHHLFNVRTSYVKYWTTCNEPVRAK